MTDRQQLMRELEQTPDELVQTVLDFLHRLKATRENHPLAKFAGILSDTEAAEMRKAIALERRQVDETDDTDFDAVDGLVLERW